MDTAKVIFYTKKSNKFRSSKFNKVQITHIRTSQHKNLPFYLFSSKSQSLAQFWHFKIHKFLEIFCEGSHYEHFDMSDLVLIWIKKKWKVANQRRFINSDLHFIKNNTDFHNNCNDKVLKCNEILSDEKFLS